MGISFAQPWWLLLFIPAFFLLFRSVPRLSRLRGTRKVAVISLRSLILILLILSLAGLQLQWNSDVTTVIFVADRSVSMKEQTAAMERFMEEALKSAKPSDQYGIVSAGASPVVEKMVAEAGVAPSAQLTAVVNPDFTNLAEALSLAGGLMPSGTRKKIVLLSDGMENAGDMLKQAELLKQRGIVVDVVPFTPARGNDAAVTGLKVPQEMFAGEKVPIEVKIESNYSTSAKLRIYQDERLIYSGEVQLEKGENLFSLEAVAEQAKAHRFRAEVEAVGDRYTENNRHFAYARVKGKPRVLIVEGETGEADNLVQALRAGGMEVERILPPFLPESLPAYTEYESVILANVSAHQIPQTKMAMIETAVRDFGTGLVMTGGRESFGLGGYFRTPVEQALPVYMDLRGKKEIPTLALILVIDKSGSMSGQKMDLTREAAMRTVELLRPQDYVGVVAFDDSPWWIVEAGKVTDPRKVSEQIGGISADGGTNIFPALEEAFAAISGLDARRKHIILLTDGHSAEGGAYADLIGEMKKQNVTLSTVAVGNDADTRLLSGLAEDAGGRYYEVTDSSTIPAIFSREAVLATRTYVVDRPFHPLLQDAGEWESLFGRGVPKISAYIATTPKQTASQVLVSPESDPLLSRWQYGLGRSVAWTSDLKEWAGEWAKWDGWSKMWNEIVAWTFPQFAEKPWEMETMTEGDRTKLRISTGEWLKGQMKANVVYPDLSRREIPLNPVIPGEYEAEFTTSQSGIYMVQSVYEENGQILGGFTHAVVVPYSPEYLFPDPESAEEKLRKVAEITGGNVIANPAEAFSARGLPPAKNTRSFALELLYLALLLFPLDVGLRKLSVSWAWLGRLQEMAGSRKSTGHMQAEAMRAQIERMKRRAQGRTAAGMKKEREAGRDGQDLPGRTQGSPGKKSGSKIPPTAKTEQKRMLSGQAKAETDLPKPEPASPSSQDRMARLLEAKKRRQR